MSLGWIGRAWRMFGSRRCHEASQELHAAMQDYREATAQLRRVARQDVRKRATDVPGAPWYDKEAEEVGRTVAGVSKRMRESNL